MSSFNFRVLLFALCGLLFVTPSARAQGTPGTVRFPAQTDTQDSLFRVTDGPRTALGVSLDSGATTLTTSSTGTAGFASTGSLKIDNETIFYTSKTSTQFLGLVRGANGSTSAAHSPGAVISAPILAAHHNTLADAIIAAETKVGAGSSTASTNAVLAGTGAGTSSWQAQPSLDGANFKNVNGTSVQCSGVDDTAGISAAVTAANGGLVYISRGQTCAASDLTIPNLRIEKGGLLKPLSGHTITLVGFGAGLYQVFTNATAGLGTIVFSGASTAEDVPQWWGAIGDDSTDCTAAYNAAIAAHVVTHITAGIFKITGSSGSAIQMVAGHTLYGDGPNSVIHKSTTATGIQNENDTVLRDFTLRGRSSGTTLIAGEIGLQSNYATISPPFTRPIDETKWRGLRSKIKNLVIENWGSNAVQIVGNGTAGAGGTEISGCRIRDIGEEGILSFGDGNNIHDNYISNTLGWGIDHQGSYANIHDNTLVNVSNSVGYAGGQDTGGIVINGDVYSDGSYGNSIIGNKLNGGTNAGIYVAGSLNYPVKGTVISGNVVNNFVTNATDDLGGITVVDNGAGGAITNTTIGENSVFNSGKKGIMTWGTRGTKIIGNTTDTTADTAIENVSHLGVKPYDAIITSNTIRNFHNAILVSDAQGATIDDNTISTVIGSPLVTYAAISISGDTTNYTASNNHIALEVVHGVGFYVTGSAAHGTITGGNQVSNSALAVFYDSTGDYLQIVNNEFGNGNASMFSIGGTNTNVFKFNNAGGAMPSTVGLNLLTATNPSAITFPKIAADNSVSFRTPTQLLSDIGAQAARTLTGTANQIDIANGSGALNPVFSVSSTLVAPGTLQTVGRIGIGTAPHATAYFAMDSQNSQSAPLTYGPISSSQNICHGYYVDALSYKRFFDCVVASNPDGTNGGGMFRLLVSPITNGADAIERFAIDHNGTILFSGGIVYSPGTPGIAGNGTLNSNSKDSAGKISITNTGSSTVTLTFANAFTRAPACTAVNETTSNLVRATSTTTTAVFVGTTVTGDKFSYSCLGY